MSLSQHFSSEMGEILSRKSRVLIVDDTADNIWFLADALSDTAIVQVARNGETALKLAAQQPQPEIVLLDVQMPGMDGYEVCRRLKNMAETADIPIVFVTAMSEAREEAKGLGLGAADYIHKPFDPAIVRARVRNLVEYKRHRDSLQEIIRSQTRALRKTQVGTIMALADVAEWRDPETGEHIKRTQEYVYCIALELSRTPEYATLLTPDYLEMLYMCAPLHDMGKVSISDAILLKPGKLTPEEFAIMQQHCEFGAQILQSALTHVGRDPFLEMAYQVARWHHDRWDGKGYPDGLMGQSIPLAARIMSVADVYDALISHRPYKDPMPHEEAVAVIISDRGKRFDPDVVDAFIRCQEKIKNIKEKISENNGKALLPSERGERDQASPASSPFHVVNKFA